MDTKFQPSFIPKKPVDTGVRKPSRDVNLLLVLSVIIFLITTAAAAGVFLYKSSLTEENKKKDQDLKNAIASFGLETLEYFRNMSGHLTAAKKILDGHVAMSPVFSLLEDKTLKTIRYNKFDLKASENGVYILKLVGEASSFNALAYQSKMFTETKREMLNPIFSDFAVEKSGLISFKFETSLVSDFIDYQKMVGGSLLPVEGDLEGELDFPVF